jgi:hypothetical protein
MPSMQNFRKAFLPNFRREFSLVSISGIRRGKAVEPNVAALAIAPLDSPSMEDMDQPGILGALFDIPEEELAPYLKREARYHPVQVEVYAFGPPGEERTGNSLTRTSAWTVVRQSDAEYRAAMETRGESYDQEVSDVYSGSLWARADILPMPDYLSLTLRAAEALDAAYGDDRDTNAGRGTTERDVFSRVIDNLQKQCLLADRSTSLAEYIQMTGPY